MKKIVLLGNTPSSFLNFRQELVEALVAQHYQVYCLAYDFSEAEKQTISSWKAIPISHHLNTKGINPFADILATHQITRQLQTIQPDIVFNFFVKSVIFGSIAAKLAKVPRIIGMIEGLGNAFTLNKGKLPFKAKIIQPIQILLYRLSLPFLNHVIFLNPDDKRDLVDAYRIPVKKFSILGGIGVDLNKFSYSKPPSPSNIVFIFIARLLKEKGVVEFLQAAQTIKKQHPHAIFQIIGDVDQSNPFALKQDFLNQFIQDQSIEYHGYVNNVQDWIQKSHVFVLPSYREGVPRSTQEAMAIGRPVITTNVPGCRETVIEGENGFYIQPSHTNELIEKILYFIHHPEQIEPMGIKSRTMAEAKFDINHVNQKLIAILESP